MPDYALRGAHWINPTITWSVDDTVAPELVPTIASAFSAWAGVSTLHFQQVDATAPAEIRIEEYLLAGNGGKLGLTFVGYSGEVITSASILFDASDGWHATDTGPIVGTDGAHFLAAAERKIGTALGLDYYADGSAVMNPVLTAAVTGLTASDIHGIQALYGTPPLDADAANVARLYYGVLGRAPDAGGLSGWTALVAHDTSLHDVAAGFLASGEYRAVSTGYTDAQFVDALYQQVLGRAGDAGGAAAWNASLAHGGTRGAVIDGFTFSAEFQGKYAWLSSRDYVEQLYEHVLGRAGDSGGLDNWAGLLDGHAINRAQVAQGFTGSAEFQAKYVAPGEAAFVDGLYVRALGRHADAGGLAGWTDALAHGTSRADVAVGIAESLEAQRHHAASVEQGWHLA